MRVDTLLGAASELLEDVSQYFAFSPAGGFRLATSVKYRLPGQSQPLCDSSSSAVFLYLLYYTLLHSSGASPVSGINFCLLTRKSVSPLLLNPSNPFRFVLPYLSGCTSACVCSIFLGYQRASRCFIWNRVTQLDIALSRCGAIVRTLAPPTYRQR